MVERYSFKLTMIKTALLALIIIVLVTLYFLMQNNFHVTPEANNSLNEQVTSLINKQDLQIEIIEPIFQGFNAKLEKYVLNASSAVKGSLNDYKLKNVILNYYPLTINFENLVKVTADNAKLNEEEYLLKLTNNVNANYSGFNLIASEMEINLKNRVIKAESKVKILFKGSVITAGKLDSNIDEKILSLGNEVHTKIHLQDF